MNQGPSDGNENGAHDEFIGPDGHGYIFDHRSRIYKPKSKQSTEEDSRENRQTKPLGYHRIEVRRDWWVFGITTVISLATFWIVALYTNYAKKQAEISEAANYNFMKSNRDNSRNVTLTLQKMEEQATQMGRLAGATEGEAGTVKEAFLAANGALITTDKPIFEGIGARIPINNHGRMDSGQAHITIYEGTDHIVPIAGIPVEGHVSTSSIKSIPMGLDIHPKWAVIDIPNISPSGLADGTQAIVIGGSIVYEIGPGGGAPARTWNFCYATRHLKGANTYEVIWCDSDILPGRESNQKYYPEFKDK
jgi:hypothetical protein